MPPPTRTCDPVAGNTPGALAGTLPHLRDALARLAAVPETAAAPERALLACLFARILAARGGVGLSAAAEAAVAPALDPLAGQVAAWTGRDLGFLYETLLDPAARRRDGIYYTPAPVIDAILAAALDPLLAAASRAPDPVRALGRIRVLDPACGAGYFLLAAARRIGAALVQAGAEEGLARARRCVYGADTDPIALDLTRYSLVLDLPGPEGGESFNLYTGDSLAALPPGWTGFDAVVGNPPYVPHRRQSASRKQAQRDAYTTAEGQYDLSVLFLERGLDLLRPGGRLGYILPNKFMAAVYGAGARRLLAFDTSLLRIDDVSALAPFPAAATYPVILVTEKTPPGPGHTLVMRGPDGRAGQIAQEAYCSLPGGIMPAAASPALLDLVGHLARQPGRLPPGVIGCGVARAGFARAAIPAGRFAALPPVEQAEYLPLLQAQDIAAYGIRPGGPATYLPRDRMTARQWAAFAGPKVALPGIARDLRAAHLPGGHALGRIYYVNDGAVSYTPEALLALLNSRVLRWYYRFLYWPVHLAGGYLRINAPYLANLPLPDPAAVAAVAGRLAPLLAEAQETGRASAALDGWACALYAVTPGDLTAAIAELRALAAPATA